MKYIAVIVLVGVGLGIWGGLSDRDKPKGRQFNQGMEFVVSASMTLYDDDGVPVFTASTDDLVGIGKSGFGKRVVYLIEDPEIRGWVDIDIIRKCVR